MRPGITRADGFPEDRGRSVSAANVIRNDSRQLLMRYGVRLNPDGNMADYFAWKEGEALPAGSESPCGSGYEPGDGSGCRAGEQPDGVILSFAQDSFLYCMKPGDAGAGQQSPKVSGTNAERGIRPEENHLAEEARGTELYKEDIRKAENVRQEPKHRKLKPYESDCSLQQIKVPEMVSVTLEEPNVLVLDMAGSRLDEGRWREKEEILRLDNDFRSELGYPMRTDAYAQPWIYGERPYEHKVSLRYTILSETEWKKDFPEICS